MLLGVYERTLFLTLLHVMIRIFFQANIYMR